MFIYNITLKIDNDIEAEWLLWQKEIHIPDILNTGLFYDYRFFKLLEQDEPDGKTFIIQFYAEDKTLCEIYLSQYSGKFEKKACTGGAVNSLHFNPCLSLCNNCE